MLTPSLNSSLHFFYCRIVFDAWLKRIRFRCWQKILEVGPVAVVEIRLRFFLLNWVVTGYWKTMELQDGVGFHWNTTHCYHPRSEESFESPKSFNGLRTFPGTAMVIEARRGFMSGGYVMSIGCMQTCFCEKHINDQFWRRSWKTDEPEQRKWRVIGTFANPRPGLALLVLQRNRRTGSGREEFCRWVSRHTWIVGCFVPLAV